MVIFLTLLSVTLIILLLVNRHTSASERKYHKEQRKQMVEKYDVYSQQQRQNLEFILNTFDDALIVFDEKLIIKMANGAARKVCRGRKLIDKTITQAILNDQISTLIKSSVEKGQPNREKILIPGNTFGYSHELNEMAWIIDFAPLQTSGDESLYRLLLSDVTSEHKTDQIKREFVANASHELRTPLSIINGYLENLIEDDLLDDKQISMKLLNSMRKHGDRLAALVEDMLSISKLESGETGQLDLIQFELKEVFEDVKEKLHVLTLESNSSIQLELKEEDLSISGDRFYWEQILFNLTENALKQNASNSIKVTLSADQTPNSTVITVRDNGKGIPAAHLPFIFNRFYRVQKHHSQNEVKGTGLGLSIVKRAVEAHKGEIKVSSTPGNRTTFTITLPR